MTVFEFSDTVTVPPREAAGKRKAGGKATAFKLKRDASQDNIDALNPGFYIIGGKKVLVK